MSETRQHYNEEFKQRTVKYVQEQTKSIPDIAEELNIPAGTIRQWMSKYRQFDGEPSTERVRQLEQQLKEKEHLLAAKERELEDVKDELTIVKKAVHIFSKPRN
jgi:transposase